METTQTPSVRSPTHTTARNPQNAPCAIRCNTSININPLSINLSLSVLFSLTQN